MDSFEFLIKNNMEILRTLFHINENNLNIIDDKRRIIRKDVKIERIYQALPIIKDLVDEIFKDFLVIETKIKEIYYDDKNEFIYKIKFNNPKISNYKFYIKLSLKDENKINCDINYINKKNENDILFTLILNIIVNYYKSEFIENDLKKLIKKLTNNYFDLFVN